ncbi:MAG: hypothetical protein J7484_04910 [Microbacterium sp.]|nr:hypothetical protein [Microbacterium sp.]
MTPSRITRARLLDEIGRERATVIRAAAGSGKTSLIVDWLATSERMPTAWVMLDEQCRSAASFWHRVIATMVGQGIVAEGSAAARLLSGEADATQAPGLLIAELNARAAEVLLVVDDLHLLDSAAQEQLRHVLTHAHRLRLIAASRTATLLDDPETAVRIGLGTLTGDDLLVTPDELHALSPVGADLSPAERDELLAITRGNMLSVRLALSVVDRARSENADEVDLVATIARQMSRDVLGSFGSPRDRDRAALLGIPPAVDDELATALVGPDGPSLLAGFVESGAGQTLTERGHDAFVFHAVVRAALGEHAESLDAEEVRRAHGVSAAHLMRWGDPVDVLKLIVGSGDDDAAWAYFVTLFSVFSLHRIDDVIRVLREFPDEVLRAQGKVAIALAVEMSEREARPSRRVVELVRWGLDDLDRREPSDDVIERCLRHTARMGAFRAVRRYAEAADAGAALLAEVDAMTDEVRERMGSSLFAAILQVAITSMLAGRLDTAVVQSATLAGDAEPGRRRHIAGLLAYLHGYRGNMPMARSHRAEIGADLGDTWSRTVQGVGWNFANALIAIEEGDLARARSALGPLQYRADRFEHWPMLLWAEAYLRLLEGDTVAGYDELNLAVRAHRGRVAVPAHLDGLFAIHADLARAVGETADAKRLLGESPGGPATDLARARLLLDQGEDQDALSLVRSTTLFHNWPRRLVEAELIVARAADRLGLAAQSRAALGRAGAALSRFELTSPLVFAPSEGFGADGAGLGIRRPAHLGDPFRTTGGDLSPRELLVLRYLRSGEPLPRLAERLHVSPNTIKSQVKSIYRKLGVAQRAAAIVAAQERGLL